MNEHPPVTLPSFQVVNEKLLRDRKDSTKHFFTKHFFWQYGRLKSLTAKSLDTVLKTAMYFYSSLVSIRDRWSSATYKLLNDDEKSSVYYAFA